VQGLPRSNLLDYLKTYWDTLKVEGIFAMPSRQVFTWTLEGSSEQVRRLHHHLILRHLDVEDNLHQWRRSIAEMRNLDGYTSFFAEAQAKQRIPKQTRQSGESSSNKAHKEYLAHIYADRTPQDYERVKQALKKDLRHGRRWSILVDGFVTNDGDSIPGLGPGLLLLCGPAVAKKMSYAHLMQGGSANLHYSYNTTGYTDPYLKSLVQYIRRSRTLILSMCEIMRLVAESLVHYGKLRDDNDFSAIAGDLKQYL